MRIVVCKERLTNLKKIAPDLRSQHLRECLDDAIDKQDEVAINAIKRILRTEAICRRWHNVKNLAKPQSSGVVSGLMARSETGATIYSTKDGVEQQAVQKLEARFKTAHGAPICTTQYLHEDFGFPGQHRLSTKGIGRHLCLPR